MSERVRKRCGDEAMRERNRHGRGGEALRAGRRGVVRPA